MLDWLLSKSWFIALLRPVFWIGNFTERLQDRISFLMWRRKTLFRIAVIGDLSLQDPERLNKVFAAASPNADVLIQIGDMHPGYSVVRNWATRRPGQVLAVPGNHDTAWDEQLQGWLRRWRKDYPECRLVGIDNSGDVFVKEDWDILNGLPDDGLPTFVFVHKPLGTIVLPSGEENVHVMGESESSKAKSDVLEIQGWLTKRRNTLVVSGHFHGWTMMQAKWGDQLVEGRGGAGPDLGFTVISVQPEGWAIHKMDL